MNGPGETAVRIVLIAAIAAVILSGCIAQPPTPEERIYTIKAADLSITLTYLDKDTLVERHGEDPIGKHHNPYIDYPAQFTKKKITVFEFDAVTETSTVVFALNDITLFIENKGGTAKSQNYMENLWLAYTDKGERARLNSQMKGVMLPREFIAAPSAPARGYLVFADPFPKEGGEGIMSFNVATAAGDTGVLELPLFFDPAGNVANVKTVENTGIFAEEATMIETVPIEEDAPVEE